MQDEQVKEKLERWLGPLLVLENIEITGKPRPGDNYLSDAFSLKLTGYIGKEKQAYEKHVFVKRLSASSITLEEFCKQAFKNEAIFYNMFIDKVPSKPNVPYCYGADDSMILMDDLARCGFVTPEKQRALSEDHLRLLLEELANLHSGSYYLKKYNNELFEVISAKLKTVSSVELAFFKTSVATCVKVLKEEEDLYVDVIQLLEDVLSDERKLLQLFQNLIGDSNDSFNVIIHSDCWLKNLMFKYNEKGVPILAALLDFQTVRRASLIADLVTMIWVNTKPGTVKYVELLKHYHFTLSNLLLKHKIDPPQFNSIIQKFEECSFIGVLISLVYLPVICMDNITDVTNDDEWATNSLYKQRVKLLVDYFVKDIWKNKNT